MTVKELQDLVLEFVAKWDKKRGTVPNEKSNFIHLIEEVGELARQYVNEEKRKDQYDSKEIDNAIADIFMQIVSLAKIRGLDLEELVVNTIKAEAHRVE